MTAEAGREPQPVRVRGSAMKAIPVRIGTLISDGRGQDMVAYALRSDFVAFAGGAFLPSISDSISIIFSRIDSLTAGVAGK